jgi:opacity protein-like surface antigen
MEIARSNVMRSLITVVLFAVAALSTLFAAASANASEPPGKHVEVSVLGGVHNYSKNDTALPDNLTGVPVVGSVSYRLTQNFAAEGEFTWFVPVKQTVDMGGGVKQDRTAQNSIAYQAGLRASLPLSRWTPYLAAGVGGLTILSDTSPDRLPQLEESQTVFALSFGAGAQYPVSSRWGLRADFREFVGFPGESTAGLSSNGSADAIWLARGTVGVDYRF